MLTAQQLRVNFEFAANSLPQLLDLRCTTDQTEFLTAGELKEYVVEEVNVRSLKTCADPLQYCTLRAEPDYPSLGKRLGKAMAKIGKAVKAMTTRQIWTLRRKEASCWKGNP